MEERKQKETAAGLGLYVTLVVGAIELVGLMISLPLLDTAFKQILAISAAILLIVTIYLTARMWRRTRWFGLLYSALCVATGVAVSAAVVVLQPHWINPAPSAVKRIECDLDLTQRKLTGEYQCHLGRMTIQATPDNDAPAGFWASNVSSWEIPTHLRWEVTFSLAGGQSDLIALRSSGFKSGQPGNDAIEYVRINADRPGTMVLRPCNPCVNDSELAERLEINLFLPT